MKDTRRLSLAWASSLLVSTLLALTLGACGGDDLQEGSCAEDSQCGTPAEAFRCDAETGACFCRTDAACSSTQSCNSVGFCQDRAGCETNADCLDPNLFCDTTSGSCLQIGRCANDLHCNIGEVCDLARNTCVPGCRSHGDCPGVSCRCEGEACGCEGTTPEERQACQIGVCDGNFCADQSFCPYGQKCGVVAGSGSTLTQCYSDFDADRRPYCASCVGGSVGLQYCGNGPNYCLVDTANAGNYFCGVDCTNDGNSCPNGYTCSDVIRVYKQCSRTQPCAPDPSLTCSTDADCSFGGTCTKASPLAATGSCTPPCTIDENDEFGFCGCQADKDCPTDTCSGSSCNTSKVPCAGNDDACRQIRCVAYRGAGGCFIGRNCAPGNNLSCIDIQGL